MRLDECSGRPRRLRSNEISLFHPLPENVGLTTLMVDENDRGSMRGGNEAWTPNSFPLLVREDVAVGATHEMIIGFEMIIAEFDRT